MTTTRAPAGQVKNSDILTSLEKGNDAQAMQQAMLDAMSEALGPDFVKGGQPPKGSKPGAAQRLGSPSPGGQLPLPDGGPPPSPEAMRQLGAAANVITSAMGTMDGGFGELFTVMLDYLKMAQKDAREDKKIARASKEISMQGFQAKIELDNKAIDKGMAEAHEKAELLRSQATASLASGLISAAVSIVASGVSLGAAMNTSSAQSTLSAAEKGSDAALDAAGKLEQAKNLQAVLNAGAELGKAGGQVATTALNFVAANLGADVQEIDARKDGSKAIQKQANSKDAVNKFLENQASKDEDSAKGSASHSDRMRDAVLDFLRKLAEINPKVI
jgi:hypothetical protein